MKKEKKNKAEEERDRHVLPVIYKVKDLYGIDYSDVFALDDYLERGEYGFRQVTDIYPINRDEFAGAEQFLAEEKPLQAKSRKKPVWKYFIPRISVSLVAEAAAKIVALMLILSLNQLGISTIIRTISYFNDIEISVGNYNIADSLDFSLNSPSDFYPLVAPATTTSRVIGVANEGGLDFNYTIELTNASGTICSYLYLEANIDGEESEYYGPLVNFYYDAGLFTDPDTWLFTASLTSNDLALQNLTCTFDFVFDGEQIEGPGFHDQEIISNTITSDEWIPFAPPGLKINEVYYDIIESQQCKEEKNEWVEIYNSSSTAIDIQKYELCHGYGTNAICNPINTSVYIPPMGFVAVGHDNSTWIHCFPDVPSITIHQLGGWWPELGDDGDYIIFKNPQGEIVDCVNWGTENSICNFPDGAVPDVAEGHSIARSPAGYDTDRASDWVDVYPPNPGTNPHSQLSEEALLSELFKALNKGDPAPGGTGDSGGDVGDEPSFAEAADGQGEADEPSFAEAADGQGETEEPADAESGVIDETNEGISEPSAEEQIIEDNINVVGEGNEGDAGNVGDGGGVVDEGDEGNEGDAGDVIDEGGETGEGINELVENESDPSSPEEQPATLPDNSDSPEQGSGQDPVPDNTDGGGAASAEPDSASASQGEEI